MAAYNSMAGMMSAPSQSTVPTQAFSASNLIGTPIPQVGDNKGSQNFAGAIGGAASHHVVITVVAIIAIGYLAFHLNFEK